MVFTKVVREVFRHLPHSLAAKAAKLASDGNWLDLVQLKIDPGRLRVVVSLRRGPSGSRSSSETSWLARND